MSTVEKPALGDEDSSVLPPPGDEWGVLAWPVKCWAKHPWLVFWLGSFALPAVEQDGLTMWSLFALVYASWVQGIRVAYRLSRPIAVAVVTFAAALLSVPSMAAGNWGKAFTFLFLTAGVPVLGATAVGAIRRRRGLPSPTDVPVPVERRRRFVVAAVVVCGLIVWFFWMMGEPGRNAQAAHDGIRSGMTLSEVLRLADGPFFAYGPSAPQSPEDTAPPELSITGDGRTYTLMLGDHGYGHSLMREELLRLLDDKAGEITPQRLQFVFRSNWIPASVAFTVTFGEDGRVDKVWGTRFLD